MQLSNFGSWFVALLSASMAAGAALPKTKVGVVEFKQTRSDKFVGRNGPLALARAYSKYGVPVSDSLRQAAEATSQAHTKRATGTAVANSDQGDLEYLVQVSIGTPAQSLNLDFDTGSADLWVFSTETPNPGSHNLYDPSRSSTAQKQSGETWSIQYADGSGSSGDVYTDTVTVGGLTVARQAVESAQQVSAQFASGDSDGLLGLSFSSLNTVTPDRASTWFDNVQSQLDSPLFVADLRHDAAGSYVFGAVPDGASDILYTPVDGSRGWWGFSASVGGSAAVSGIADTGTTLLLLDDGIVGDYYRQVAGAVDDAQQGGWVFDCDARLPSLSFAVGGGQITIDGSLLNYAAAQGGRCYGGLQSNGGNGLSIFGDVALKAAYVVFDAGNNRLGWAQK